MSSGDAGLGVEITLADRMPHKNVNSSNSVFIWREEFGENVFIEPR